MGKNNLLAEYREEVDADIQNLVQKIAEEKKKREYVPYSSYVINAIKQEILSLGNACGLVMGNVHDIRISLPPPHIAADLTLSVFEYAKTNSKAPAVIAQEFSEYMNDASSKEYIDAATPVNGYINLLLKKEKIYDRVTKSVNELQSKYGESDIYKDKLVFIDYSSPNIAKPIGVGHLRSTIIGQALANMYKRVGFSVIKDNHLGDWGTQFGSLIYAYKNWGDADKVAQNPIEELKDLYVRFNQEAENNPALKDEARKLFMQLEQGDEELVRLWKKFRDLSVKEFEKTYDKLGVVFDCMIGESYYIDGFEEVVADLEQKGIATKAQDGAVIVEGLNNLPTFLLQKNDGSSLYVLRDIVTLMHRKSVFDPDKILYVVGSEQKLNFEQLFALCEKAGYSGDTELEHVDFGMVLRDGKKMATRKGTLINLEDVLREVTAKAKEILIEKGEMASENIDSVAEIVGTSAVVYADLKQNRNSNIEFDWDKMLSLESGSSVYLQYTYARIISILSKVDFVYDSNQEMIFEDPSEFRLAFRLAFLPDVLLRAVESNAPHIISLFLEELTADFNHFYSQIQILKTEDNNLRNSRLILINAVAIAIKNALALLNIPVLNRV
jgi:arginyl-tRNA synthetase